MERLIQAFGAWLKQGFGWFVDVLVYGCLWGMRQISRLFDTQFGGGSVLRIVILVLVLLLLLILFYWLFRRFIGVIRWSLDQVAYALGIILLSAIIVSGLFASAGLVAVAAIWIARTITLAIR